MRTGNFTRAVLLTVSILLAPALFGQQQSKPLTNADVIKMVNAGVPEAVIVTSIQSSPAKFDVSPDALIALHQAGVTPKEMDAILAASRAKAPGDAAPPSAAPPAGAATAASAAPATSEPKFRMPSVAVLQQAAPQNLPLEKTQLAQTKTSPKSMASLAGDTALTQTIQAGVNAAAWDTAVHTHSVVGGSMVNQAGGVFSGVMGRRKPTVTYVWGVPNPVSATVLHSLSPQFSVNFADMLQVNANDFEPTIVKLTPAQNTCRIVGATQGKEDAQSSPAADWEIYSSFLEERVAVKAQKTNPGEYKISPASPLFPGEYAVVLRPVSKSKKFSGGDVARAQGDGFLFDAVWSFQVATDAQ